jgi:hypothetical protein
MSLADGIAWEREFGTPEYCEHGIAKGSCSICATARELGGAMSEKHQECSECGKPLAHRVHSPTYGTHAYREPVASPQATRPQGKRVHPDTCLRYPGAAQPAAGTTRRTHELSVAVEGDQLVIRIGIDALVCAAEHSDSFQPHDNETCKFDQWKIRDADEFAKEVANQLHNEEEDGSTAITRAIDDACLLALESGCKADLIKGGAE